MNYSRLPFSYVGGDALIDVIPNSPKSFCVVIYEIAMINITKHICVLRVLQTRKTIRNYMILIITEIVLNIMIQTYVIVSKL